MIMRTNQDAYKAIMDSILLRWNKIISNDGNYSLRFPDCQLCNFTSLKPSSCSGCPIDMYNEELGRPRHICCTEWRKYCKSSPGSPERLRRAKAVRNLLLNILEHFFPGDQRIYQENYHNYRKALHLRESIEWKTMEELGVKILTKIST